MAIDPSGLITTLNEIPGQRVFGRVSAVLGLTVEVSGVEQYLAVGGRCDVMTRNGRRVPCEVIGFKNGKALLMAFGSLDDVGLGCKAEVSPLTPTLHPTPAWCGRILNALAEPIDRKGPLPTGIESVRLRNTPPPASERQRVAGKVDLGVKALNTFTTMCRGQRMGIFAASGVGKSVLMAMLARSTQADVNVIGLIGERGREVQEFIEDTLGEEGLKRSVLVVATSDEPALMRRQAAYTMMAIAEYFRDQGQHVLCMMDSVTRFALAQREIGLSAGEPPTTKGFPPTVFGELPRLLERAGPGKAGRGFITGLFTVLVEGDDHDEPVSDAVRGIVDGHIVLERSIAERGRYPAINVLRSISRMLPMCNTEAENKLVMRARRLMATYDDMAEMIRLGAYRKGSNPEVDEAIQYHEALEEFLAQKPEARVDLPSGYAQLAEVLGEAWTS